MKKILLVGAVVVSSLFASDAGATTDFVPRLVNFVIFAAILYYLLADKVKAFFSERSEKIAKEFQDVQDKIVESKKRKDSLKAEVEKAHSKAEDIVKTAKEEAKLIKTKIEAQTEFEIANLEKQLLDYKESETANMKREVVAQYMKKVTEDVKIDSKTAANIISRKVVA